MVASTRILIVEDDARTSRAWRRILKAAGFEVEAVHDVAEARSYLTANANGGVDIVLLDLDLPDGSGTELIEDIARVRPRPRVVVLSGYLDSDTVAELYPTAMLSLPKPVKSKVLIDVVATLASGSNVAHLLDRFGKAYGLSQRQVELLELTIDGLTNKEAADALGCHPYTIQTYWKRIFKATRCNSQRQVLADIIRFGLGEN